MTSTHQETATKINAELQQVLDDKTRAVTQRERAVTVREQVLADQISEFSLTKVFVPVDDTMCVEGYMQHSGKILQTYVYREGKTRGSCLKFKTLGAAVQAAYVLGSKCAGIRMEPDSERYTLQTGLLKGKPGKGLITPDGHNTGYRPNWITWVKIKSDDGLAFDVDSDTEY